MQKREEEQFQQAQEALRQALQSIPNLQNLAQSLMIDATPEGLRIQIVDQEGLAMFPSGTAKMFDHTRRVLGLVAQVIRKMPQKIAIAGHTDSVPFGGAGGYGNWELSADRANASRRALIDLGVPTNRVSRVVGKADDEPLLPEDPANPRNRRLSIILLRGTRRSGDQIAGAKRPDEAFAVTRNPLLLCHQPAALPLPAGPPGAADCDRVVRARRHPLP